MPQLAVLLLILLNPLNGALFTVGEGAALLEGPLYWLLYMVEALYMLAGSLYFFRFSRGLGKADRWAALVLIVVAALGVALQAFWSVRVELFFEAVALFGFMALLEHDDDAWEEGMSDRFRFSMVLAVALIFLSVILMDVFTIRGVTGAQSEELGHVQLEVIRGDLEDTIAKAETDVLRVSMGAEQLIRSGASRTSLARYIREEKQRFLTDESFMNLFIAGPDWHIVPDFHAPADFHASERVWYLGAREHPGKVYVTEPYLDADTGSMCFTVSTLLSDGETVVGMDLNFSQIQASILRMTRDRDQSAMIVSSGGLIVGYTDMSLVGERAADRLPEYESILKRVSASQEHRSFRVELNGRPSVIFSAETENGWYLILSVDTGTLYAESYRQMALMAGINLLMLVVVVVFYLVGSRNRHVTLKLLTENRRFLGGFAGKLRESAARVRRLGDVRIYNEGQDPRDLVEGVRESGRQLDGLSRDLDAYTQLLETRKQRDEERERRQAPTAEAPSRRVRNEIILVLCVSLAVVLLFCLRLAMSWGGTRMNREADRYENLLNQWLTQQVSVLSMFTDMISSQPELLSDYDNAVRWLGAVSGNYPEISLCFLANPYAEHPVIMSNGWEPGEDYRPETRPWYRETERSATGFSISAPYLDAQSGNYCITLSRVVYGEKGEFLGIFGIDFFLDSMIRVLGESYTSQGYAFLVDSQGVIINHPHEAYEMQTDLGVSVEDTEYAEAFHKEKVLLLRDYTGRTVACLSRHTDSGFTVLVANRWWDIYGSVAVVLVIFLALFGFCLLFIVGLINRLIRWQGEVNAQLVEAAETAVNAGRAKSQFLAQMSHEIRTPMNAIIGLDNIALRDPDLAPHTREELEKIGASASHLLSLINDILDMSRIESGRLALKEEVFSFREFLDQINVIVGGQCEDKGLSYQCHQVGALDASFLGDDLKLKQVLINILGNSVKFTDAPGAVTLTVRETETDGESCLLTFTMEDTGVGMDREYLPRLFEAFSQENASTTNRYGGSGLGMAITKNIVEMMGGEIRVESEKGLGTTFTVTVPMKRAAPAPEPETAEEAPEESCSLEGRHLLVAEDNELNAEILIDLLELEGVSCEWAENGQLAVECFQKREPGHFDGILMDMRMPVMDGLGATREIRKLDRPDAATIPIVALTANAFEEDVQQCLQAGMDAHLSKPVDMDLLKATLGRLLGR